MTTSPIISVPRFGHCPLNFAGTFFSRWRCCSGNVTGWRSSPSRSPRVSSGFLTAAISLDLVYLPGFMLGIVAAHIAVNGHRLARWASPALGVCLLATCAATRSVTAPLWLLAAFAPALEAMMFLFVVGAGSSLWLNRVLSAKWLTAVGLASYSIYLVHMPVMDLAMLRGVDPILASLLGIGVGFAFWYAAERPFIEPKLRDRLVARLEGAFSRWLPRVAINGASISH